MYCILTSCLCCVLQVLEFLHDLFDMFRDEGYMMTESEAAILIPCLMEKVFIFICSTSEANNYFLHLKKASNFMLHFWISIMVKC